MNPNVKVIEAARDAFPKDHYMYGALDHAAAELAVLHGRCQRSAFTPPEGYEQALQDAARYRYIREIAAGEPSAFGQIEDAAFAAHYGDPAQFDLNIDDQIAARPEVKGD